MKFWGVTGTNGKTTTTWIFAEFLNACPDRKCGYVTTVEVNTTARRFYTGYTTPPLAELKKIFAEMESAGCTDCVMEVSSHAIHQHRTGDTVFSGGAFTNLSEDHLDYHKTMAAYFDVKLDFARQIAAAHPSAPSMGRKELPPYVVCLDGGYGREMFDAVGNLAVNVIPASIATSTYNLNLLPLVGDYNKSNVLVAAALAEAAGVPHETIERVIPTLKPRWGRLERVENPDVPAEVYVDFAHTPDGLEKVLTAVRGVMKAPAQLWVVFGAGGDRDPMKRPLMGAACARLADRLVVTSDNPRSEDPMKIIDAILKGVESVRPSSRNTHTSSFLQVEPDRHAAIRYALENARKGDVVVIAGKGHETTQEICSVKHPFDDRAEVRAFRRDWKALVERTLDEVLPKADARPKALSEAMRYAVGGAGKRIRPLICLGAAVAVGGSPDEARYPAAAIEILHNYTLVHDDLPAMDNDTVRRGAPSVWAKFGEANAILAGDALLALAYQVAAKAPRNVASIVDVLGEMGVGVVRGQVEDVAWEKVEVEGRGGEKKTTSGVEVEDAGFIYEHKTSDLFMAAAMMGALAGGGSAADVAALRTFALNLGLAFQYEDDLLDSDGAYSREETVRRARETTSAAIAALGTLPGDTSFLRNLAEKLIGRKA